MNKVELSAEEILDSHYKNGMHWKVVNRNNVLQAMETYLKEGLGRLEEENMRLKKELARTKLCLDIYKANID